jgi:hypothetical protein
MKGRLSGSSLKIFVIRSLLGVLFAFMLMRFFFPAAGLFTVLVTAGLLVFFAYLFESIRRGGKP